MEGPDVNRLDLFRSGLPIEGPIDVEYFENIPNESVAREALEFLMNMRNEIELRKYHSEEDLGRMWRAAIRGCLTFQLPIPIRLRGYARRLGIVFSE